MDKCNLCGKNRGNYEGSVWYHSSSPETQLCKGCMTKWNRTKECKELKLKFENAKPTTKPWEKMCKAQQKAFDRWYYTNGGTDE